MGVSPRAQFRPHVCLAESVVHTPCDEQGGGVHIREHWRAWLRDAIAWPEPRSLRIPQGIVPIGAGIGASKDQSRACKRPSYVVPLVNCGV
jgi:hypothetical protein